MTDKFGDHGLVITATMSIAGESAEIDTLLMSCRVMGREIDRAFLVALVRLLAGRGIRRVTGHYIATPKNGMVREFYAANGFTCIEATPEASSWLLDPAAWLPPEPRFVSVTVEA